MDEKKGVPETMGRKTTTVTGDALANREYAYDLLRVISCISVVIIHVSGIYQRPEFYDIIGEDNLMISSFFRLLTSLGVPMFVMLSGAFNLRDENSDFRHFYRKMTKRIVIPTLVFSVIYVMIHYAEIIIAGKMNLNLGADKMNLWSPLVDWLRGIPNVTMWYMYMILPLYMITPALVLVKKNVSSRSWHVLAVMMLVYSYIVAGTCTLSWVLEFTKYLGYFFMGDVIREFGIKLKEKNRKHRNLAGAACIALSYAGLLVYWYLFTYKTKMLTIPEYVTLIVIAMSLLQFLGFSLLRVNKCGKPVRLISKYSLEIYLMHPAFLIFATQLFCRILRWLPSAIGIPVYTFVVTMLCIAVYALYERGAGFIFRRAKKQ